MKHIILSLEDQAVALRYPESLQDEIGTLFGDCHDAGGAAGRTISLQEDGGPDRFSLQCDGKAQARGLDKGDCLLFALGEIVHALVTDLGSGVALHAGAVTWEGQGILLPGTSGAGKSCLTAWLIDRGFDYLTDELAVLGPDVTEFTAFTRPLVIKEGAGVSVAGLETLAAAGSIISGANVLLSPETKPPARQARRCRLMVFPRFEDGASLRVEPLSAAEAALELTACNVNARNLADHGFGIVTSFARGVPAVMLHYGSFTQLDGVLETLVKLVVESDCDAQAFRRLFAAIKTPGAGREERRREFPPVSPKPTKVPAATPRGEPRKLTIGMATYDDYDGVYFTLQALRMYHPEIVEETEFLVVDNNPEGRCAEPMKGLEYYIPNFRYVPYRERVGTTIKDVVFEEAAGEIVLCMDCHVFVVPGAVRRLLDYCDTHADGNDLLQGPLVYDDLTAISTHFEPTWREGMFGTWETDERGRNPDAEPFEIPMQGMGLFACRRAVWPGFNIKFRGFGGEEGYIHEKFRQAGGRTLCVPFLRWMHRFNRPLGIPYENTWDDRVRNYMIGFTELGLDLQPVEDHFAEFLGPDIAGPIIEKVKAELAGNEPG